MIPASHQGHFTGINRLWLMPGTPADVSDGTLEVASDRLTVRWSYEGLEKVGELVLSGPAPSCRGEFTDTFHAASGMVLNGYAYGSNVFLYGTYSAGDGSPAWGWRIVLDWADPDQFSFRMFNVLPDGMEALAVDLCGSRAGD